MAVRKSQSVAEREDELVRKISECTEVVEQVRNSNAWKIIYRDLEDTRKKIDDNWHLLSEEDSKQRAELRITKLATMQLLNLIDNYEHDAQLANMELHKIRNPNTVLNKYYDGESNYEQR